MGKTEDLPDAVNGKAAATETESKGKVINIDESIKIMFNHVSWINFNTNKIQIK